MRSISGLFSVYSLLSLTKAGIIQAGGAVSEEYDYVIVGSGASGLVVAHRLSEDQNIKVLVIEAGGFDYNDYRVMAPGSVGREWAADLDYGFNTVPQTFLNGETRGYPQGKVVGGGTLLNGLVWTRASSSDYDSWVGDLGNEGWSWTDLWPYFTRSENFNGTVTTIGTQELDIAAITSTHGHDGPIEVSYTPYYYEDQAERFLNGCAELGITIIGDTNTGNMTGASMSPSSIKGIAHSRDSARKAYWNPIADHTNLDLMIDTKATRILFDRSGKEPVTSGVEFAVSATANASTITASQEVIVAGGAVWTPTLLQVSGIGRRAALENIGVEVVIDLPGVGNNMQDHPMVSLTYDFEVPGLFTSNNLTGQEQQAALTEWEQYGTGPYSSPMISHLAFPSLASIANNYYELIQNVRNGQVQNQLPTHYDDGMKCGYEAQIAASLSLLGQDNLPVWEVMPTSYGELTISIMHPFSRGNITAASASIFDAPLIDPRYCSHAFDCDLLMRGLRWNDRLVATKAMQELQPVPRAGYGPAVDDAALRQTLYNDLRTNFHPSSTTAMLPRNHGGIIDNQLRVYGVQGLHVVDASVFPTIPGGHLQAAVYATAEKAADLIHGSQSDASQSCTTQSGTTQGKTSQSWTNNTSVINNSYAGDLVGDVDGVASRVVHNLTPSLTTVLNPERKPADIHAAINAWLEGKGRRPNSFLNGTIFPVLDGLDGAKATAPKKKCGSRKRV